MKIVGFTLVLLFSGFQNITSAELNSGQGYLTFDTKEECYEAMELVKNNIISSGRIVYPTCVPILEKD